MSDMRSCPFCGGTKVKVFIKGVGALKYGVVCESCDARSGRKPTKAEALQEWNRRAQEVKENA